MLYKRNTFIALVSCVVLLGCSKLTNENYSKIKVGMPFNDVATLIGKPASCDDVMGVKSCRWVEKDRTVTINFIGNQVVLHAAENIS